MRLKIIAGFLLVSTVISAQPKKKVLKAVYSAIVDYSYHGVPSKIGLKDSAYNDYILKIDYWDMAVNMNSRKAKEESYPSLDSSWIPFLKSANGKKQTLKPMKITRFTVPGFNIFPASVSRMIRAYNGYAQQPGKIYVNSQLALSGVILSKDRAIVEVNRSDDLLNGEGNIYFLKRVKKKWIVVSILPVWIS